MLQNWEYNKLEDISQAIGDYCAKWGRIHVLQTKEKYGTVRVYCSFRVSLHSLLYPKDSYIKFPKWLHYLDLYYIEPFLDYGVIGGLIFDYQTFIYRQAYKKAIKAYPQYKNNILSSADNKELLLDLE